jgi:rod shape-determining protein MreD
MNPRWWLIPLTLLIALMLAMVPLPRAAEAFRPAWVTLVALYWAFALPQRFGLTLGWCVGLLLDVAQGALLGQNALAIVLVVAFARRVHQRLRVAPVAQQAVIVTGLLFVKQALVLWTSGLAGRAPGEPWLYFAAPLSALILWPVLFVVLRDLRRRYQAAH